MVVVELEETEVVGGGTGTVVVVLDTFVVDVDVEIMLVDEEDVPALDVVVVLGGGGGLEIDVVEDVVIVPGSASVVVKLHTGLSASPAEPTSTTFQ